MILMPSLNTESIDCFIFSISYTFPEIITKRFLKKHKEKVYKTIYLTEFHLFFSHEGQISKKFIVPAVTVRKMHGREVVSFYRVASLTAYIYLRKIIILFLVSHYIKVYNIFSIYNIHKVYSIYKV